MDIQDEMGLTYLFVTHNLSVVKHISDDIFNPKPGCRFSPRCELCIDICKQKDPEFTLVDDNHHVACFRANEIIGKK